MLFVKELSRSQNRFRVGVSFLGLSIRELRFKNGDNTTKTLAP